MISENYINHLFKYSSFLIIKKDEYESLDNQRILSILTFNLDISKFHPDRKKEYELVRVGIYQILKNKFNIDKTHFVTNEDRSPVWPSGLIGSITHTHDVIIVAVSDKAKLLGIDLESLGRMKKELGRHILVEEDPRFVKGLTDDQLMTLIFCAKEALYKALYPKVNKFFGFDSAFISSIDTNKHEFKINLIKDLNSEFNSSSNFQFNGKYYFSDFHCLAVIELI